MGSDITPLPVTGSPAVQDATSEAKTDGRTIVLCFDGTGNEFSDNITNVLKLYQLLKKEDDKKQLCYYQTGIGTNSLSPVIASGARTAIKIMDQAIAGVCPGM